ncbi:hypothetical protein A2Z10_01395 [Candidatus Azambacteria bacterium RBG_16_47_10]|uniref:Type 4 fimbrial biogenesis protein PilX N-terminal domain-containing protein n=1 Tax=Candidatus Azambacteria bacterium RBG_16_47_10 TaxID=1797292 RepID=A0A1F5AY90_9BACT|nr:MAG: hypothetical protein A2Z10_01395 [Candidatus Azambacteria bacterium RBG_16_47_10]
MTRKNQKGMGLIEIILVVGIISASFFAIGQLGFMSMKASKDRSDKVRALAVAQEGMEAVRTVRDAGWTDNIATLSFGSAYYVATSSGQWLLTVTDPGLIANTYARTVVIDNVSRDINDDITAVGGIDDPGTKKVTTMVTWGNPAKTLQLVTYITNILKN